VEEKGHKKTAPICGNAFLTNIFQQYQANRGRLSLWSEPPGLESAKALAQALASAQKR
jgi:hypothetical protein